MTFCATSLAAPDATVAEDSEDDLHPFLTKGLSLHVGAFFPDRELDLRINGSVPLENLEIDFDERFNLKNTDETFAGEIAWQFRGKWSVLGQYFKSSGDNRATLEENVEWRDLTFLAGTNAAVGTDFELLRVFFGRELDTSKYHDVGIGGGFHLLSIEAFIEGTVLTNFGTASARESVNADAPLPNIGAWYTYSITPRWAFRGRFDLLSADVGDYEGIMINGSAGVNFNAFEHFGVGLAYNYFELDVSIDKSDWRGDIETTYDGVFFYVSAFF